VPVGADLVVPVGQLNGNFQPLPQAALFDPAGVIEINAAHVDDVQHLIGIAARKKAGLFEREPSRGRNPPVNRRSDASGGVHPCASRGYP
jgi:hypothetical protein